MCFGCLDFRHCNVWAPVGHYDSQKSVELLDFFFSFCSSFPFLGLYHHLLCHTEFTIYPTGTAGTVSPTSLSALSHLEAPACPQTKMKAILQTVETNTDTISSVLKLLQLFLSILQCGVLLKLR